MKIRFLTYFLLLFLIFFNLKIYGNDGREFFDSKGFLKEIKEALITGEASTIVAKTAPYLKEKENLHIPNCFECSMFLIKSTLESEGEVQLAAADIAVKFSPDFPEARLHFISRLTRFAPFKMNKIFSETKQLFNTFFRFPPRDMFFYSIFSRIKNICILFIFICLLLVIFKYPSLIVHRYMHLAGHSRFYALSLLLVLTVSGFILAANNRNLTLVIMTILVFFSGVVSLQEKFALYLVFIIFILSHGMIILTENADKSIIKRQTAFNHLNAVYSPSSASMEKIDTYSPGGSMAKGFMFFYQGNYNRSIFHLRKELNNLNDEKIKISIQNLLGISLAASGNYSEAVEFLKSGYESSGNVHIGYNLAKAMFEGSMTEDALKFEKKLMETAGAVTLSYPYIYIPDMFETWNFFLTGKETDNFENIIRFVLFILGNLLFYMFLMMVRLNYMKGVSLSRCPECGTVMCSKCNAGGLHICAVCKLMKADPDIFIRGEKDKYEIKREHFFARQMAFSGLFTVIVPGGGLIFSNKTLEGSAYLFLSIFIIVFSCLNNAEIIFNIKNDCHGTTTMFLLSFAVVIYLISIVRGFIVSRG